MNRLRDGDLDHRPRSGLGEDRRGLLHRDGAGRLRRGRRPRGLLDGGKATLHTYVSNLRRVLGDVIVRQGDAYLLDCAGATIDAATFEALCARAVTMFRRCLTRLP